MTIFRWCPLGLGPNAGQVTENVGALFSPDQAGSEKVINTLSYVATLEPEISQSDEGSFTLPSSGERNFNHIFMSVLKWLRVETWIVSLSAEASLIQPRKPTKPTLPRRYP
mgnify:CR=1 FL=1